jgi:hypothetical protein
LDLVPDDSMGLMGLTAGILSIKLENNRYLRVGFGFSMGFLYGWINNVSMLPFLSIINMTGGYYF